MPPSAPNSLGEIRLERLRRLAELKARKAAKDAQTVQNVAARFPLPGDLAKLIDPTTVVTPALKLLDANLSEVANGECERLVWSMPPQEGKDLALDTPIATPAGWTVMGNLRVGDRVFDRQGEPCTVTWLSPIWRNHPCYVVRTGDGEAITAGASHEWLARLDRRSGERLCTSELLAKRRSKNAQITGSPALNLPDADLPLDPYTLGAWLGDGHSRAAILTNVDMEIIERIRMAGIPCRKMLKSKYNWSLAPEDGGTNCSPVRAALVSLGVWGNKHIPDRYLRGSTKQRLALLQGLVDTDGYVSPRGQTEFCSVKRQLALDVQHLVFSLGAKATLIEGRSILEGIDRGPKYRVRFYLADAAWLSRKAEHCKDSSVGRIRYTWAHPTTSVPTRCIEVDSPDHTYLAGKTLLPTHNSQRVSRTFPLWMLLRNPELRIIIASYELGVARRWSRAIRNDIVDHPELGLKIREDTSAAHEWQLLGHKGGLYSAGIGGGLTGRPCDLCVIDDPLKGRAEADSEAYRENAWDWWTETVRTRLAPHAPVVLVMTRWAQDDLAGRLIEQDRNWRVINVPAQAEPEDPLGREEGEYLTSARGRTPAQWDQIRAEVGERAWNALYQGRPAPAEGGMFKRSWWQYDETPVCYRKSDGTMHAQGMDVVIQSWDMTFKNTDGTDFVVGQVWGRAGTTAHLLDQVRARLDFPETCKAVQDLSTKWPQASLKLIEDKANGPAVISQLRKQVPGMVPVNPEGNKQARAAAVTPFVEAGNVCLPMPARAPWIGGLIEESAAFPNGAHDDQVDALTQALARLMLMPSSTAFLEELVNQR